MSTILKALRRIEEGKADGLERPLREDVVLAPTARRRINPSALIAIAAVAFAATVAMLTWVHDRKAARVLAASRTAVSAQATSPVSAPPRAVAPLQAAQPPQTRAEPAPSLPPHPLEPSPAATAEPEVVLLNPEARGASPIAVVSESPPAPAPPIAARPAPPRAVPPSAPSLRVLRTSWHPRPEKRVAWVQIEGAAAEAVHEGDRIGNWVVREIEPAAVVLSDGAGEIRRRVGSP